MAATIRAARLAHDHLSSQKGIWASQTHTSVQPPYTVLLSASHQSIQSFLQDLRRDKYWRHPLAQCSEPVSPCNNGSKSTLDHAELNDKANSWCHVLPLTTDYHVCGVAVEFATLFRLLARRVCESSRICLCPSHCAPTCQQAGAKKARLRLSTCGITVNTCGVQEKLLWRATFHCNLSHKHPTKPLWQEAEP